MAGVGGGLSACALSGEKVRDRAGEDVGTIADFMLDLETGKVAYAVLSFGGVLGIGNKLFAVPPDVLALDEERGGFVLDIERAALAGAPGFDADDWPDFADRTFTSRIESYYRDRHGR